MLKKRQVLGKVIVCLPFDTLVNVSVIVNATFLQRIKLVFPNGKTKTFQGNGEGNQLASFVIRTPEKFFCSKGFPVLVKIKHSPDGRNFIRSRVIKEKMIFQKVFKIINVFSDDSFGDNDFNDAIVSFSFRKCP